MTNISTWIIRGPIELRSSIADINLAARAQRIDPEQAPHIEAAALASGWRYGLDWGPVIRWAIDGQAGQCPRPRGRPRKGERANSLPD